MASPPGPRGLAIDLDGTLLDSMGDHARTWQQAFEAFGLLAPIAWFYQWEGVIGPEVVDLGVARLGANMSAADRRGIYEYKQALFNASFQPRPIPGAETLRRVIERLGYPVAVVTGSEHDTARRMLDAISFDGVVKAIIGGDDVRRGKPAPDPYLLAAERLGAPLSHMLVLENAPEGIRSARAADMLCIAVETTLDAASLNEAHRILPGLEVFAALLEAEYDGSGGSGPWHIGDM